jgi:Zn2+/Cd2+-exporting ATPase
MSPRASGCPACEGGVEPARGADGVDCQNDRPAPGWRLLPVSGTALAAGLLLDMAGAPRVVVAPILLGATLAGGTTTARRAWSALRGLTLDINVLMVVAVVGAAALGEWSEAASVTFLFALAGWIEGRSMDRARHAIRSLMAVAPSEALVRRDGGERRVATGDLSVGETIIVRPGERIPIDGRISLGDSDVDQAAITGESAPVAKQAGDDVFAGTINGLGALEVLVTRLSGDTTMARIIDLVESAQAQRAPSQAFVERFARFYTPAVIGGAVLVAALPPIAFGLPAGEWFSRALVLLVISCPCALVISTPISVVSALAGAARRGVLIKGGVHLERAAAVKVVAFDKTGTLTRGRPEVVDVIATDGVEPSEVLRFAAAVEARSEHPLARAIVRAHGDDTARPTVEAFRALPGLGAEAVIGGEPGLVGNRRLFEERRLYGPAIDRAVLSLGKAGRTAVLVARNGCTVGIIGLSDTARDAGSAAVAGLKHAGIARVVMLTGDNASAAEGIAASLGLDEWRAGLLPADKVAAIADLSRRDGAVAMVGDGVNDAPALAAASVGVAMGAAGSDAALETADIALMSDDLLAVPYLVRLGRATVRTIRVNVAIALGLKALFLAMALGGVATLWMAVAADMGASLLVIANGVRLLRFERVTAS